MADLYDRTVVAIAWQTGRDHTPDHLAEAADDLLHAAPLTARPPRSYEERVAHRHNDMLLVAVASATTWRGTYPGGPVDWDTGRVLTAVTT